jgi:hypothetical protein
MDLTKYKNIFPHVAAAIQLSNIYGKQPSRGDIIQYVYTDSQQQKLQKLILAQSMTEKSTKKCCLTLLKLCLGSSDSTVQCMVNQKTRNGGCS